MKANWGAIPSGVPDLRAEVRASVRDGLVVRVRLFAGLVQQGGVDINDSVRRSRVTARASRTETPD